MKPIHYRESIESKVPDPPFYAGRSPFYGHVVMMMMAGVTPAMQPPAAAAYFERQVLQRCAVHAANNLLQRRAFSHDDFSAIAAALTPPTFFGLLSPHRAPLGLGNFDANVLLRALCGEGSGRDFRWLDARCARALLAPARFPHGAALLGFLANRPSGGMLGRSLGARHWFAVREIGGAWWELDSMQPAPLRLCGRDEAAERLAALVDAGGQVVEIWQGGAPPPPYLAAPSTTL